MAKTISSSGIANRVNRFFFDEEAPFGLALIRASLPLVVLTTMLPRWVWVRELYSLDGAPTPLTFAYPGWEGWFPIFPATVAVALFTALIVFSVALMVGWMSRLSAVACCALFTYFTLCDAVGTMTKYAVITSHVLLLLSLSRCGEVWSVDAWLKRRRDGEPVGLAPPVSPAWPRRLIQLLIGIVYLGAAATKMHTPSYFSGDQLMFWMRTELNSSNPLGDYLAFYPALMQVMAYITIIWEVLFLFMCWQGLSRKIMLTIGIFFHVMTLFTLGLIVFPMLYCFLYLSFVNTDDVAWARLKLRNLASKLSWKVKESPEASTTRDAIPPQWWNVAGAAPVFGVILAAFTLLGVMAEYHSDLYGERRPEGRYALIPASDDRLNDLFGPEVEIAVSDQLFSFEVGTVTVGGTLADRRRTFEQGEHAVVQCCFNPPHEDMWVEVDLHDHADRIIVRNGQILPRELLRSSLIYPLTEGIASGEYSFVLKVEGMEVARRRFLLTGSHD